MSQTMNETIDMKQFTIYCTEEQCEKALKLGAPIHESMSRYNARISYKNIEDGKESNEEYLKQGIAIIGNSITARAYNIPTAEQMVGWIDEQHLQVTLYVNCYNKWCAYVYTTDGHLYITTNWFDTRKGATIAAIDAALDYLTNKK